MNVLIQLSHPAHFHLYKNVAKNLMNDGHQVFILIKTKDILEDLLQQSRLPYYNILKEAHRKSKLGILWDMFVRDWRMLHFVKKHKIDLLTGSTAEVAQVGWVTRKYRINTGEDDMRIIPLFRTMAGLFVQTYLSPETCDNGTLEPKSIKYAGFHKLAYLHPKQFLPDRSVVEKYFPTTKPYFVLRFAQLKAYHDISANVRGINTDIAQHLIDMLLPFGDVYITSERELEPQFEKYRLNINPLDIHHVLAFAKLYIGDSQSMAVEAAMLGTPSLRFNDFAGKIGVLEELEHKYELTYAIPSSDPRRLYDKVEELLVMPNLDEVFHARRQKMLSEKIDVTALFTWFIENYPESKEIMKSNPDFQYQFK
jgi:predicted glycosyltransferase